MVNMIEPLNPLLWLLLAMLAYYLIVPLRILFRQKIQAHPRFEALDFNQLTPTVSEFLMNQTRDLLALGFNEPALMQVPNAVTNLSVYQIMLVNRGSGDTAQVTTVIGHQTVAQSFNVQFRTRFDAGEGFVTLNTQSLIAPSPLPNITRTQVPMITDCRELFGLHNYITSKYCRPRKKVLYDPGRAVEYLSDIVREYREAQVQRGWLSYDRRNDIYRYTVKGAYLETWGFLQPFKPLRHAAMHMRARRILREFRAATSG
jgi:hypothetical protein